MRAIEFESPERLRDDWLQDAGLLAGVSPPPPNSPSAGPSRSTRSTNCCHRLGLTPGSRSRHAGAPPCGGSSAASRVSVDPQIHSALVQRRDLVGGNETRAAGGADHKPVEDVLVKGRDDVVYRADLLAT